ncbi:MAG TPA: hypothetical protein VEJ36_05635 [Nitrososphaerales archaeon]|nr:hypothetical protein [Nitrososphaerales archaeon]
MDWFEETISELGSSLATLEAVREEIRGEPSSEQMHEVWLSYVYIEKGIAFIKIELEEENPGRRIHLDRYRVPDERQALAFAVKNLRSGLEMAKRRDLLPSLKPLRESRNYLRALLREKELRKRRTRSGSGGVTRP